MSKSLELTSTDKTPMDKTLGRQCKGWRHRKEVKRMPYGGNSSLFKPPRIMYYRHLSSIYSISFLTCDRLEGSARSLIVYLSIYLSIYIYLIYISYIYNIYNIYNIYIYNIYIHSIFIKSLSLLVPWSQNCVLEMPVPSPTMLICTCPRPKELQEKILPSSAKVPLNQNKQGEHVSGCCRPEQAGEG